MRKRVISFGEALWDLLPEGAVLGGAPCNLACRVNELGDAAVLVSRVGADRLGREALERMRGLGLDTAAVQVDTEHPTGTVEITFDEARQPDYVIIPGVAYDFMEPEPILLEAAAAADCICFGTLAQRGERSRATLSAMLDSGTTALKFLDVNLRKDCYSSETVSDSLERANIVKLNEDEVGAVAELVSCDTANGLVAQAAALRETYALTHCIVTLAERGVLCVSADEGAVYEPGYITELADPCGAGDALAAGFLHYHLRGKPLADCLRLGNALGAIAASQRGATQPIAETGWKRMEAGSCGRTADKAFEGLLTP